MTQIASPYIWTPQGNICRRCGKLIGSVIDRAKRLRASLGVLFAQGSYVKAGGEVVKPTTGIGAGVVGDTADCGVCPCGGGSGGTTCDCGTCTNSSTPRSVHLLGFDGPGTCNLLPTFVNYYKVTGTIDISLSLPIQVFNEPPCYIVWSTNGLTINSGLTSFYYRDSICTIPQPTADHLASHPFIITAASLTYSCYNEVPSWRAAFSMNDSQIFAVTIDTGWIPATACQNSTTLSYTPPTSYSGIVSTGSFIVATA